MKTQLVYLAAIILVGQTAFAQPDTVWTRHYGGSGEENCRALVETSDGGFALLGQTTTYGAGSRDYWLVRADETGAMQWSRAFGGTGEEIGYGLRQTADGGFILAGRSNSFPGNYNAWIVRTNAFGDTLWTRKRGGSQRDDCYAVAATPDGGFVGAGYTTSWGFGTGDFWLFKLALNGDSLWSHTYGGTGSDICWAVVQTPDSGFLLAGQTQSFGENHGSAPNFWIVRTDANGDSLWSRTYGGSGNDVCAAAILMPDSGFLIGGYTQSFGAGREDAWLLRLNSNGDSLWGRTFGSSRTEYCTALMTDSRSNCFLAGWTTSASGGDHYWLLKADSSGNEFWQRTIGGAAPDQCNAALAIGDSVYMLAGGSYSFTNGGQDFWLVKTRAQPPTIQVSPSLIFYGPVFVGDSRPDSILIENISDVSFDVLGLTAPHGFYPSFPGIHTLGPYQSEWMTVAFAPDSVAEFDGFLCVHSTAVSGDSCVQVSGSGIGNTAGEAINVPKHFRLSAYPNPFNTRTVISYDLPRSEQLTLRLYDLSGKLAQTLADGITAAGSHHLTVDGSTLASGVYFVSLQTPAFQTTHKLVLIK